MAYADTMGQVGNPRLWLVSGKSTDTMGQLVAGTVTSGTLVKPTAAIPANTSLVANLPNSFGRSNLRAIDGRSSCKRGRYLFVLYRSSRFIYGSRQALEGGWGKAIRHGIHRCCLVAQLYGMVHRVRAYRRFPATAESASMASATTKAPRRVMCPRTYNEHGCRRCCWNAVGATGLHFDLPRANLCELR